MMHKTIEEVVEQYQGLIVYWANRYRGVVPNDDLIQSGNEGICLAYKRFDSTLGDFTSYASQCIKGKMTTDIRNELRRQGRNYKNSEHDTGNISGRTYHIEDFDKMVWDLELSKISPDSMAESLLTRESVWQILHKLSSGDFEVLYKYYFEGLTLRELGYLYGRDYGVINMRVVRARANFKKLWEKET